MPPRTTVMSVVTTADSRTCSQTGFSSDDRFGDRSFITSAIMASCRRKACSSSGFMLRALLQGEVLYQFLPDGERDGSFLRFVTRRHNLNVPGGRVESCLL